MKKIISLISALVIASSMMVAPVHAFADESVVIQSGADDYSQEEADAEEIYSDASQIYVFCDTDSDSSLSSGITFKDYAYTKGANNSLTINGRVAKCTTVVTAKSSSSNIVITQQLQKKTLFSWSNVTTWTKSGYGRVSMTNTKTKLTSGTFRLKTSVTTFSGLKYEGISLISSSKKYLSTDLSGLSEISTDADFYFDNEINSVDENVDSEEEISTEEKLETVKKFLPSFTDEQIQNLENGQYEETDLNLDGKTDVKDVSLIMQYYANSLLNGLCGFYVDKNVSYIGEILERMDVDGNGYITAKDALDIEIYLCFIYSGHTGTISDAFTWYSSIKDTPENYQELRILSAYINVCYQACKHDDDIPFEYNDVTFGDVNNDDKIDSKDATSILKSYAEYIVAKQNAKKNKNYSYDECDFYDCKTMFCSDVNNDYFIDEQDAIIILQKYANEMAGKKFYFFTKDTEE